MKEYKPIEIKKYAAKSFKTSSDGRKFKKFKEYNNMKLDLTCSQICVCADNPNLFVFFAFDMIYYFDLLSDTVISKYPLCSDKITGGVFRSDGKLLMTGLSNGIVNVYEPLKKTNLRSYKSHKLQINCIDISSNFINFASGSNDMAIKLYTLSDKKPIDSFDNCHNDYITSIKYLDENTLISGSYDKLLKIWDIRANSKTPARILDNQDINSDILVLSTQDIISTSDNKLHRWDLRSDKIVNTAIPLQNKIEKISCDKDKTKIFIAAAEKFVKVIDLNTFNNNFTIKFQKEISAFAISSNMDRYGVGFIDGEISIRGRSYIEDEEGEDLTKEKEERDIELLDPQQYAKRDVVKNYKYFYRGQYDNSETGDVDIVVPISKKKKLDDYDKYLKKFEYHNALDSALQKNNTEIIVSVIEELIDRNALKIALLNRTEEDLELLIKFLLWKLRDPKTIDLLLFVVSEIIDYYCVMFGKSSKVDDLFSQLLKELNSEIEFQENLIGINAKIDSINNIIAFSN